MTKGLPSSRDWAQKIHSLSSPQGPQQFFVIVQVARFPPEKVTKEIIREGTLILRIASM